MHTLLPTESDPHRPGLGDSPASIRELVAEASDVAAPVWPLKTFIAANPLQGLEGRPFEMAVQEAERFRQADGRVEAGAEAVNRELIKWCSAFFDEGQATLPMPNRQLGFYRAFADLARFDRRLAASEGGLALPESLPSSPETAIDEALDRLGIAPDRRQDFIRQSLAALPGWSGHVKWRESWQDPAEGRKRPAKLVDYVAVRLVLTRLLWPDAATAEARRIEPPAYLAGLPEAEGRYREGLLARLVPRARSMASNARRRPDAQIVFCIDVRSEPMRRAVEEQGHYETLGFAGFFGLPVKVQGYGDERPHDSCPVLLKAGPLVRETPLGGAPGCIRRNQWGRSLLGLAASSYRWLKYNIATPFALVEILGPWLGLRMLARTFTPGLAAKIAGAVADGIVPPVSTEPCLDEIAPERRADLGESALRAMGLAENLAPLVVLCGHGGRTTNNAYASALDCGACGGNRGGPNARILAAILNDGDVRSTLTARGLKIPTDTLFLAGEHDTTTDRVGIDAPGRADAEQLRRIEQLRNDLAVAGVRCAQGRGRIMGLSAPAIGSAARDAERRSSDWAEVRPEWGLARNAAFIVGPRSLTRDIDLDGRCFLHSYDWEADRSGAILTVILTAPMVVAQWINSQYLFSTLDNVAYGAGSKVTQNITGKMGVMQGNASDLMHGLPLQSVYLADDRPYHEPLRLLAVVYAPRPRIDAIVREQEVLRKLFGNGWVSLACIDPSDDRAYILGREGDWGAAP
ncbi:MAG: DUF2309 domain-containing protein [Isosphaeraceae bacterium]